MNAWTCADVEREVFGHLAGQLAETDALRAHVHLQGCAACAALSLQWDQWRTTLQASSVPVLSPDHAARLTAAIVADAARADVSVERAPVRTRRVRAAIGAAMAIAAAVLIVFVARAPSPPSAPVLVAQEPSASTAIPDVLLRPPPLVETPFAGPALANVSSARSAAPIAMPPHAPLVEAVDDPAPPRFVCPESLAAIAKHGKRAVHCLEGRGADAYLSVAESLLARGARADAEVYFVAIGERFAGNAAADALYASALIAIDTGREYVARERLERYLATAKDGAFRADAAWRLATLLTRARQLQRATPWLDEVIERSPSSSRRAEALFLLGSMYDRELDNLSGALVAYRRAMAEPSAAPEIKKAAETRIAELLQR
ncbi:MAG: hypothetical protein IT381_17060 [Deltaproteobacteria bacterium]|nr:hypothetical protein [Deltaproteobacteria bacterium]